MAAGVSKHISEAMVSALCCYGAMIAIHTGCHLLSKRPPMVHLRETLSSQSLQLGHAILYHIRRSWLFFKINVLNRLGDV